MIQTYSKKEKALPHSKKKKKGNNRLRNEIRNHDLLISDFNYFTVVMQIMSCFQKIHYEVFERVERERKR